VRRQLGADGAELGNLSVAVQDEQIAGSAQADCAWRARHADSGQARDNDGPIATTQLPSSRQGGDHRPGAGQQDDVRLLSAQPTDDSRSIENLDR
jgi:hypothetical protein